MLLIWTDEAWDDYLYWQSQDKKTLKRINKIIKDIQRNGAANGIGMPEPLRGNLSGYWSRRIDDKNHIVYRVTSGESDNLEIAVCRTHYGNH
ncbi:Txe/YoeB family addiction module toxin [Bifidobacterium parmae]|uniref:Endoribonuclease YoeB n=1 Tax=Bifidobacterium parmae TaxID=361854 RepID=A0A2N5J5P1_9BIFI|nr:Txe/YoeB family addiction module toxin [Bifidobacterium parmae]PLS29530.1 addiction module protein [Bifidobacterium parmae]